ncbi:MAG TPA: TrmH family RNA methyltransferase [Planctomycetota bacterium]|nr:TrmH family RNA methyltransferase [Planctomycetota bacterium]
MAAPPRTPAPGLLARCRIVLVRTQGPVNLGMVARLCGNLSISDLRLVAPKCEVDCEDARKFSTWGRELLLNAPVHATLDEAVADCGLVVGTSARVRDANLGQPITARELPAALAARPAAQWALVFGNEADGLSVDELYRCQVLVRLETFGENYSFNLSHAVAILGYALATSEAAPPPLRMGNGDEELDAAPREMIDKLMVYWLRTLDRFRYFRRANQATFEPQFRRMMNRQHWTQHDVQMLWGMLGQMNYHVFGERDPLAGEAPPPPPAPPPAP